jgi:hypothetical protein
MSKNQKRHPSCLPSTSTSVHTMLTTTLARGEMARRALTVRLLGYIITPAICVFPTIIIDLMSRARPVQDCPPLLRLIAGITASLMGTCNTIFFGLDPSVVAVVFWPYWKKEQERTRKQINFAQPRSDPPAPASTRKLPVLGDLEMGEPKLVECETQDTVISTPHHLDGLEFDGHFEVHKTVDFDTSVTSTIGYDTDELARIFHGL